MGFLRWLAGLFSPAGKTAGGAGAPGGEPAFVPGETEDVIVHRRSGFRFPVRVGAFRCAGVRQHDDRGLDVSVSYNHERVPLVAMTVYVYPAESGTPEALTAQHEACKQDVASLHGKLRHLGDEVAHAAPGGTAREGQRAVYEIEEQMGIAVPPSRSEILLFVHRGSFVKYRITYPCSVEAMAAPDIRQFMDQLAWP